VCIRFRASISQATVDFTHQDDGFLAKILVPAGSEDVPVGAVLALMVEESSDVAAVQSATYAPSKVVSPVLPPSASPSPTSSAPAPSSSSSTVHIASAAVSLASHEVMPSARALIANLGVDPAALRARGTGKAGRITKGDVLAHVAVAAPVASASAPVVKSAAAAAPAPAASASPAASSAAASSGAYKDAKPSTVRKVIAARLTESKARVPHQYVVMDCRIDALLALRTQVKRATPTPPPLLETWEARGIKRG
jgi:pyruvate dehydrogenase E2 component (dihydrolipoamide acetyltransferase)